MCAGARRVRVLLCVPAYSLCGIDVGITSLEARQGAQRRNLKPQHTCPPHKLSLVPYPSSCGLASRCLEVVFNPNRTFHSYDECRVVFFFFTAMCQC